ncbi:MAG: hypothetical protein Q7U10_08185 [Thermodesulfovibrionia bacterium]|nr:hypothetical protein [Thermodesulfovibrionia bacterium]
MKKCILRVLGMVVIFASFIMFAACVLVPAGRQDSGMVIVPRLPELVILVDEPYYYHSGYYYYYQNNRWFYSHAKSGPWMDLPRGHYPKEVKYKGRDNDKDKGWKRGNDDKDRD